MLAVNADMAEVEFDVVSAMLGSELRAQLESRQPAAAPRQVTVLTPDPAVEITATAFDGV